MAGKPQIGGQIICEYLEKWPTTPTLTLAKKIYKEHPEVWTSVETVRDTVRYYRGTKGKRKPADKRFMNQNYKLPEPDTSEQDKWQPYKITGKKVGIISDLQMPFYDKPALEYALEDLKKREIDTLLMNGDIMDCYNRSDFMRDPRVRDLAQELEDGRNFAGYIREYFPKARIIWNEGNHEERWERWLKVKAPELLDMPEFRLDIILQLPTHGIEYIRGKRPIKAGRLTILHGHEIMQVGTINPARNLFIKCMEDTLISHVHKSNIFTGKSITDNWIKCYTIGCLCHLRPQWFPNNQWNHGHAYVEIDGQDFDVDNVVH